MFDPRKIFTIFSIVILSFVITTNSALAKLLPQAKNLGTAKTTSYRSSSVGISAKLRKDRRAITVSFSNLQNASSINYSLTYETNGKTEGVGGSIKTQSKSYDSRELLFGTCSSGVCTYHANIQNAKLIVTSTLTSGAASTRKFRVRI